MLPKINKTRSLFLSGSSLSGGQRRHSLKPFPVSGAQKREEQRTWRQTDPEAPLTNCKIITMLSFFICKMGVSVTTHLKCYNSL